LIIVGQENFGFQALILFFVKVQGVSMLCHVAPLFASIYWMPRLLSLHNSGRIERPAAPGYHVPLSR